jgi:LPS sulfotransferase NodH
MDNVELYDRIVFANELTTSLDRITDFFSNRRPEKLAAEVASFDPELPADTRPKRGLVLCITPRSGSTALSTAISNTTKAVGGFLGYPAEHFNLGDDVLGARARHYGCQTFEEYVERVLIESTDRGGTFSVKGDFVQLFPALSTQAFKAIWQDVSFVYLYRRDVVAQAVSLARAHVHGIWNSSGSFSSAFELSEEDIANWASMIVSTEAAWSLWFSINNIEPIRLAYEDYVENPYYAVGRMYEKVHGSLNGFPALSPPKEHVTRNASSAAAGENFRQHFKAGPGSISLEGVLGAT